VSGKQLLVGGAIILALAAHVGWWYWPRERAGLIEEGSLTASILTASDLPYRAWVAYPHQNLGALEGFRRRSDAVARLAEVPMPELPSFGPLATPPAVDLVVASSRDASRLVLAARVFPTAAFLARWAGRLAGNPWLAGGAVGEGAGRTEIAWHGSTWTVARGAVLSPLEGSPGGSGERLLAAMALAEPSGPLPAGLYLLRRRGAALELATAGGQALETPAFLAIDRRPLVILERSAEVVDALALLDAPAGAGLPRWAVVHRGRGRRRSIPGEGLYDILGREPLQGRRGGARLAATDRSALEAAAGLAAQLEGAGDSLGELRFVATGDLVETADALGPLVEQLARLPLEETRRWGALLAVARSLGDWSEVSVLVAADDAGPAVVRLARRVPGAAGD
jgi:hypothetical protein